MDWIEWLFSPVKASPTHDLSINADNSVVPVTLTASGLGVILNGQLSLAANITEITHSCILMLYNMCLYNICLFLT